jgi:hypothetical protein
MGVTDQAFINRAALGRRQPGPEEHDPRNDVLTSATRGGGAQTPPQLRRLVRGNRVHLVPVGARDETTGGHGASPASVSVLALPKATARLVIPRLRLAGARLPVTSPPSSARQRTPFPSSAYRRRPDICPRGDRATARQAAATEERLLACWRRRSGAAAQRRRRSSNVVKDRQDRQHRQDRAVGGRRARAASRAAGAGAAAAGRAGAGATGRLARPRARGGVPKAAAGCATAGGRTSGPAERRGVAVEWGAGPALPAAAPRTAVCASGARASR